jgi:hypothetical protein
MHPASGSCPSCRLLCYIDEGLKLAFSEDAPSDDEFSRLEATAEAKRRAIEDDEEDVDEKTEGDRKYEDDEIVYL